MKEMRNFLRDFTPWILFQVIISLKLLDLERASIVALLSVFLFNFKNLKRFFLLEWATLFFFLVLSVGAFFPFFAYLELHPIFISNCALSVIAWLTIFLSCPFTIQYAKEKVPKAITKRPFFLRINYILTTFWAIIFSLMALFSFLSDYFFTKSLVFNDILPVFLIIIAIHFTQWFPNFYKRKKLNISLVPRVNIKGSKKFLIDEEGIASVRPAKKDEAKVISSYMSLASGGVVDFLLSDLLEDVSALEMLESFVEDKYGTYSYRNTTVCEVLDQVVGIAHCYPLSYEKVPDETGSFIPKDRIEHLMPMFRTQLEGSLYLHTIAVDPSYQGKGIGNELLLAAKQRAKEYNFKTLALHAWKDNPRAVNWYKDSGFKVLKTLPIEFHPMLPHKGGLLFMALELSDSNI